MHSAALASGGALILFAEHLQAQNLAAGADIFSLIILLLILPLMIWSRYKLRIHTKMELLGGALSGFVLTFIELIIVAAIW